MSWNTVPDFGDEHAITREWVNGPSGARMAEVLYDAHDREGNIIAPDPQSTADGHGRWVGIEVEGVYEMVLWQHPRKSGGKTDYGFGGRTDAIADLEADIARKEALIAKATKIAAAADYGADAGRAMAALMDEWKKVRGWHTPREEELWQSFRGIRQSFFDARDAQRASAKLAKHSLVDQARAELAKRDFRSGGTRMRELMDAWKQLPSAGRDDDDALWADFNGARKEFFDLQHDDYVARQERMGKAAQVKASLIERARELVDAKDYSRESADAMRAITDEWKAAGSAGRERDDELWASLREVQDPFWKAHRAASERRRVEREKKHASWCSRMEGVIAGKEREIERVDDQINYLEYRATLDLKPEERASVERDLAERNSYLARIRQEIDEIRSQM